MVWVIFEEKFRFQPEARRQVSITYNAGTEYNVTRECVDQAEAKAVPFSRLNKGFKDGNYGDDEGARQVESPRTTHAEDGSSEDDGSGEAEREGA